MEDSTSVLVIDALTFDVALSYAKADPAIMSAVRLVNILILCIGSLLFLSPPYLPMMAASYGSRQAQANADRGGREKFPVKKALPEKQGDFRKCGHYLH